MGDLPDVASSPAPVVVVGGGLAGLAAVVAAVDAGANVVLLEAGTQVGGQITQQLVAPLDEHRAIETHGAPASYRFVRDAVRAHYRRQAPPGAPAAAWTNPGNGWVSRLCFEPRVGAAVLDDLLARVQATGRLKVLFATRVTDVQRAGARICQLDVDTPDGPRSFRPAVVVDATELGDLLPLADAPWVTGAEARSETGERLAPAQADPGRTQAITVCAVLRRDPRPGPVLPRPVGYERLRDTQPFTLDVPDARGRARSFGMYTPRHGGPPPFWTYRRVRDAARLGGDELAVLNWPGNDYVGADLVAAEDRDAVVADARRLTLALLHWLQTEAPRDDGGHGHPELQPDPAGAMTADGLAAAPYVREARRLRARRIVTAEDLLAEGADDARATWFPDSGGVGWYPLDVHAAVGERGSRNDPTRPFQVPLRALVADEPVNLVATGKAMGTTHLSNGAYRVHPVEWSSGTAAGALAAVSVGAGCAPSEVVDRPGLQLRVQRTLLAQGAELAWTPDVPRDDPRWSGLQLLAAFGALEGPVARRQLDTRPDDRLDGDDRNRSLRAAARVLAADGSPVPDSGPCTLGDLALAVDQRLSKLPPRPSPPVEWS